MSTAIATVAPEVAVNGSALSATQLGALTQLRVERGLCMIARATLRVRDEGYAFSAGSTFQLGHQVSIKIPGGTTLFTGVITGVRLEQASAQQPELVVIADDKGYKLLAGIDPNNYEEQTFSDIITALAGDAGLRPDISSGHLSAQSPYLLRTGSALSYLEAIAQRTGIVWWIDEDALVVRSGGTSSGTTTLSMNQDLINFSVRASGLRPTGVKVTGWDLSSQQTITGEASSSSAATRPTADFVSKYLGGLAGALGDSQPNVADLFPVTQTEADTIAQALAETGEAAAVVARGTCWANPGLVPGSTVSVTDAGPTSGDYYVSSVEHVYDHRGFTTRFVAGPMRPSGLVDTLGAPASDAGFRSTGLVIGVVSDNKDSEGHYRVKVKFPGLHGGVVSTWARVVSPGAGSSRGMSFQPEVNDEVLVGFEFGDSRRPVVIGALYSPNNALPKAAEIVDSSTGKVEYRRMTSRLGHVVELGDSDTPSKQHVLLQLGDGNHKFRLGKDKTDIEIPSGEKLSIKAGDASIVFDDQGNITITGMKIALKATQDLTVEGLDVSVKANVKLAAEGGAQLDVKGAIANVQADGPLALKGAVVNIN
ncbi:MAG: hypothetical protein EPN43_05140 [Jatrophihabitans sp.]|nr:MAG: hypothetical protein EPN43_05140 [Jatrophihabitans sp.]